VKAKKGDLLQGCKLLLHNRAWYANFTYEQNENKMYWQALYEYI